MPVELKLLLVGCGKMGSALLEGILRQNTAFVVCVVDPAPRSERFQSFANISWVDSFEKIDPEFKPDVVIVAVKPQQISVLAPYARFKKAVFLSIAAGIPIAKLQSLLSGDAFSIVRTMPNLPASIGQGITAATASPKVTIAQKTLCDELLNTVGETVWVDDENLVDVITALTANGPAYIFALCEAMAQAGEVLGLTPPMAAKLARQTVMGSGALLAHSPESAEMLRKAVTSPGGTTEAALKHLLVSPGGLNDLMLKAIKAGADRARELAQ